VDVAPPRAVRLIEDDAIVFQAQQMVGGFGVAGNQPCRDDAHPARRYYLFTNLSDLAMPSSVKRVTT